MANFKRAAYGTMAATLCLGLTACGGKTTGTDNQVTGDVYVPSFSTFTCDMSWVSNTMVQGDKLLLIGDQYEQKDDNYTSWNVVATYDLTSGQSTSDKLDLGYVNDDNHGYSISCIQAVEGGYKALVDIYSWPTEEEMNNGIYEGEQEYKMLNLDENFKVTSEVDLTEFANKINEEQGYFYATQFVQDKDGNYYFVSDMTLYVLDKDGNYLFDVSTDQWFNNIAVTGDGQIVVFYMDEEYNMVASVLDVQGKKLGTALENVPSNNGNSGSIFAGEGSVLYVGTEKGLYKYDVATQQNEFVFDWIDCDINNNNISGMGKVADGDFVSVSTQASGTVMYDTAGGGVAVSEASTSTSEKTQVEIARIKKTPASEVKQKTKVTLAMPYVDYDFKEKIIAFNKYNDDYRITINSYINDDWSNYEEALKQFSSDMAAGTAGDIVMFGTSDVDMASLASKGVFADLYEYFDKDADISRDDIMDAVLKTSEMNGKLYGISNSFTLNTLVGKTSIVGDGYSWSFSDVADVMKKYPDAQFIQYVTKSEGLQYFLMCGLSSFYNEDTGVCNFNSDEFTKLLEICNNFPEEYSYDEDAPSPVSLAREDKLLVQPVGISDMDEYLMYKAFFDAPVTFIGFPTTGECGTVMGYDQMMCINAKSKNKDAAWAFIKNTLSYDNQIQLSWRLPVNKKAFEDHFANLLEQAKNNNSGASWMYDDVEVTVPNLTQEDVDSLKDLLSHVDSVMNNNQKLYDIVSEEAQAFFKGQKTAAEVADIIQSRAQNYINESR